MGGRHRSTEEWGDTFFEALAAMDHQHPGLFRVLAHAYTSPEFARAERHFNAQVARRVLTLLMPRVPHLPTGRLEIVAVCVEVTHALFHLASTNETTASDVTFEARRMLRAYLSVVVGAGPRPRGEGT